MQHIISWEHFQKSLIKLNLKKGNITKLTPKTFTKILPKKNNLFSKSFEVKMI